MDYALSMIKDFPVQGTNLVEEMKELGKLCSSINMNEQQQQQQQQHQQQQQPVVVVVCPKPRRLNFSWKNPGLMVITLTSKLQVIFQTSLSARLHHHTSLVLHQFVQPILCLEMLCS
ncbi:uncharacterized protein LOC120275771 isoform X2 [Dioscorea cayenensis subsp. rotundata]|uniref:Uncharacterized protein LOC120275771 isoform X2 n=1 Tax=Dioscorea cayennensis subsp. rotundata TaxID=55577 RepID=A0AB40CEZ7_DIOCR|nr:uncharacterized protein LOC120275771 isoform X2 [Dioscorea cayenensis subsp. rotundata]